MRGIVWTGELEVRDDVEMRAPAAREVKVRIQRAGLCHSDISVINGTFPFPTPVVSGHEGAGIVEEIGSAVTKVRPGDHVVLTTLGNCGQCDACDRGQPTHCRDAAGQQHGPRGDHDRRAERITLAGKPAFQFANLGVFAEFAVVHETQAVVISPLVPFDAACLIGCAVVTGAGAVLNRAKVKPGQTMVVIGAGGIGQSVIQAGRLAAAGRIVVIDANPLKEAVARRFGATDFIDASSVGDTVTAVKELGLPNGVDYVFECVGQPVLIRQAVELLDWGGTCVMIGLPALDAEVSLVVSSMYHDKSILGCRYGAPAHTTTSL
jgi:Zn-dependent alcohol dehydrogenase